MAGIAPKTNEVVEVAAAGTAQPWKEDHEEFQDAFIQADPDNTGNIAIGDENVDMDNGIVLVPGEKLAVSGLMRLPGADSFYFDEWFVDAETTGDKLRILSVIRR